VEIADHGQSFRVTGLNPGPEPHTLSYERAFELQGELLSVSTRRPPSHTDEFGGCTRLMVLKIVTQSVP
jgi:hypothetical protein